MDYVKNIVFSILKESVEQPKVEDAIRKHYEVIITYSEGNDNRGKGRRVIQPTTLGISKSGNLVLRAFQPNGDTKTKTPHWKLFRLDRITSWKTTTSIFQEPPGMYNAEGEFNKNGDRTMSQVLLNANFGNSLSRQDIMRNIEYSERKKKERYNRKNNVQKPSEPKISTPANNKQSVIDMSKSKDFGNGNYSQTVGPVMKGETSNNLPDDSNDNDVEYRNELSNGPVHKGDEQLYNGLTKDQIMKNIEFSEKQRKERELRKQRNTENGKNTISKQPSEGTTVNA